MTSSGSRFFKFCISRIVVAVSAELPLVAGCFVHPRCEAASEGGFHCHARYGHYVRFLKGTVPVSRCVGSEGVPPIPPAGGWAEGVEAPERGLSGIRSHLKSGDHEPLEEAALLRLSFKTVSLVAIVSAARVSEIHALQADLLRLRLGTEGPLTWGST